MKYTQFLTFEICKDCNLAAEHKRCPSADPRRWESTEGSIRLTDEAILGCAVDAYRNHGFRGNIAWHYYNEPMLQWDRIRPLITAIMGHAPQARFTLWTNGTLLTRETPGLDLLDQIWVSNYQQRDWSWLRDRVPRVVILDGRLDGRLGKLSTPSETPCLRPFNELVIDHYGNGRLCCMDWRGQAKLGNVFGDGFGIVVKNYRELRAMVATQPWSPAVPDVCRYCIGRQSHIADLVPSVQGLTNQDRPWG